jgi:hypothetical protein
LIANGTRFSHGSSFIILSLIFSVISSTSIIAILHKNHESLQYSHPLALNIFHSYDVPIHGWYVWISHRTVFISKSSSGVASTRFQQ